MLSMTGFGVGEAPLGEGRISLELRALNHRYQDVRLRLPSALSEHAFFLEQLTRQRLGRGRYDLGVRAEGPLGQTPRLAEDRAEAAFLSLCQLRDRLAPGTSLSIESILQLPDLFVASGPDTEVAQKALSEALEGAIGQLFSMRQQEGKALQKELGQRIALLSSLVDRLGASSKDLLDHQKKRLQQRVTRLLTDANQKLDPGRLEQEIALLADKSDITEELVRLESHLSQFSGLLDSSEPVGRRLDFLLQEMSREVNTIGAKCQHAPMAHVVVDAKAQVERLREQVQNVE